MRDLEERTRLMMVGAFMLGLIGIDDEEAGSARRGVLVVTGAVALLLALSSIAFACTVFKGQMTVTGDNNSSHTMTVVGDGESFMVRCKTLFNDDDSVEPESEEDGTGDVTLEVDPHSSSDCGTHQLDDSGALPYDVRFSEGAAYVEDDSDGIFGDDDRQLDCMGQDGVDIGDMDITNGSGSGTYDIPNDAPANAAGEASAICVTDKTASEGQQAPLIIV